MSDYKWCPPHCDAFDCQQCRQNRMEDEWVNEKERKLKEKYGENYLDEHQRAFLKRYKYKLDYIEMHKSLYEKFKSMYKENN